jgi:galactokinase
VKRALWERVRAALPPGHATAFWVPGRVEVLGKHTDYAGGRSLICAVDRGFVIGAVPRDDATVRLTNVAAGDGVTLSLDAALPQPREAWMRYPATVLRRVARNFPDARLGADIAFLSNLPLASGMSSSSAFMVAVFLAVAEINRLSDDERYRRAIASPEDLAGYLATVENGRSFGELTGDRGVGTFGGSEDHTAMLCSRAGEVSQYAFCPVRRERQVPCPAGHRFVIAVSGVMAEKTGAARDAYNRASLAVQAIVGAWEAESGRVDGSLAAAIERAGAGQVREMLDRARVDGFDRQALLDRFDQFVEESTRVIPSAADALATGDLAGFGILVDRSQRLAERLLRNQVPETEFLARAGRELGAVAASAFGAGFGGSVWALVPEGESARFADRWRAAYATRFPGRSPAFIETAAGAAAARLAFE